MDKNKTKFFWTYTTILFAAAFVIILFAAIASDQHQEFRDDEKQTFQHNSEMLNEITDTLYQKEAQLAAANETVKSLNEKVAQLEAEKTAYTASAEALFEADRLLKENNIESARQALANVNPEILTPNLKNTYNTLSKKLN